jgi:hypothetical protein
MFKAIATLALALSLFSSVPAMAANPAPVQKPSSAPVEQAAWTRFTIPGTTVSALFPTTPVEDSSGAFVAKDGTTEYGLIVQELPGSIPIDDDSLRSYGETLVSLMGGTSRQMTPIVRDGIRGIELLYQLETYEMRHRIFVKDGNTLIQVIAATNEGASTDPGKTFADSVRLK